MKNPIWKLRRVQISANGKHYFWPLNWKAVRNIITQSFIRIMNESRIKRLKNKCIMKNWLNIFPSRLVCRIHGVGHFPTTLESINCYSQWICFIVFFLMILTTIVAVHLKLITIAFGLADLVALFAVVETRVVLVVVPWWRWWRFRRSGHREIASRSYTTATNGATRAIMIVGSSVLSVLWSVLIFFRCTVCWVIVFRWENVLVTTLWRDTRVTAVLSWLQGHFKVKWRNARNKTKIQRDEVFRFTIDWDPERLWADALVGWPAGGPIVPECPFPGCGNVWNCIALLGSISSRKPRRWKVAYGQISSSMPEIN